MANPTPPASRRVAFYEFELDLVSGDLRRGGEPVHLATQPAAVLTLLVERAGDLVLRTEIQDHVWGDLVVEQEQGLNTCIRQVRTALGDRANPPHFIETVPRRGYRFIAPVDTATSNGTDDSDASEEAPTTGARRRTTPAAAILLGLLTAAIVAQRPWSPARPTAEPAQSLEAPSAPTAAPSGLDDKLTDHPQAREAYLRGRYLLERGPRHDPNRAEIELRRALDLDPDLAEAHVALADAFHVTPGTDSLERQREALLAAIEIDPNLAAAHLRLAKIQLYADWDFADAGRSFERAFDLAPDDPEVLRQYAVYLAHLRRHDEAIQRIETARRLDPVSVAVHGNGASIYFAARRYEKVVEVCQRALELAPDHYAARTYLLHAYHQMGRLDRARHQAVELMRRFGATEAEQRPILDDPDPGAGLQRYFEWQLDWLRAHGGTPVGMAAALLPLGRVDEVFEWLEKAYDQRAGDLLLIAGDPRADAFRGDPRFVDLLRRIGFPDETIER